MNQIVRMMENGKIKNKNKKRIKKRTRSEDNKSEEDVRTERKTICTDRTKKKMYGQNVPSAAAFVRKVLVVSKLIWRNGEAHSFIPSLFIALYEPVRVM